MLDRRPWRLYLAVCILLGGGLFLTLSVLDAKPDDVAGAIYPHHAKPYNRLGPLGAAIAHELRQTLGVAVYVFLAGWFVVVVDLVLRRSWLRWSLRSLGWLLLVPSASVLAERWPALAPLAEPPLGPGGSLGAWLNGWLEVQFQPIGQYLLLGGCLALGLLLTLDFLLLRLARLLWWYLRANIGLPPRTEKRLVNRAGLPPILRPHRLAEPEASQDDEEPAPVVPEAKQPQPAGAHYPYSPSQPGRQPRCAGAALVRLLAS